jgi:hypothetical protein
VLEDPRALPSDDSDLRELDLGKIMKMKLAHCRAIASPSHL